MPYDCAQLKVCVESCVWTGKDNTVSSLTAIRVSFRRCLLWSVLETVDTHMPKCVNGVCVLVQANVWTEYISDEETVEYMLLPRLCAMSEALWSAPCDRNWQNFLVRLKQNLPHLEARGVNYRPLDWVSSRNNAAIAASALCQLQFRFCEAVSSNC